MSMNKIRFSEIVRLKKGDAMPEGANKIVEDSLNAMGERNDELRAIENGKWYGVWRIKDAVFCFRHGVCQSITKTIKFQYSLFEMNIINTAIDFKREVHNG
jgi:hypothetical protein